MSYCRWSSNDFQCDAYVYEDVSGGWTLHVAGNRPVIERPPPLDDEPPLKTKEWGDWFIEKWWPRYQEVSAQMDNCERQTINHPDAGETFNYDTPGEMADKLQQLLNDGLIIPQSVINILREEQDELDQGFPS